jgi:hypothetical protein
VQPPAWAPSGAWQQHDAAKHGCRAGFVAAFTEGPIDFYKSQIQVQIIRSKTNPDYKRESADSP